MLRSPDGTLLSGKDDGAEGTNSRIVLTLPTSGIYTVLANSYGAGETGRYTLTVQPSSNEEIEAAAILAEAEQLNQQVIQLYQQGRYSDAIPIAERALELREQILGDNHPDVASSLNNLALLYRVQGRYQEAEDYYQRSLAIREQALPDNHPSIATSLNNLAWLYQAQDDAPQAIEFLESGLEVEETNLALNLAIGSEACKQAYINTISGTTDSTISLHLQSATTNPDAARLALTTALRRKGRILDAVTASLQRLRQNLSPDEAPLLDEYTTVQSQLAALLYGGLGDQEPDAYRAEVERLQQESDQLENELARRSAEFRVETAPVEIEAVQALIPNDAVLVELVRYQPFDPGASQTEHWGEPRYAAYVLHPSGEIQWADLGDADTIDQKVAVFLRTLESPRNRQFQQAGRELDELLVQPIRSLVGDATHLLISPDGQLNLIPFAALVDENGQYLVENYQFTYLTTGRDLLNATLLSDRNATENSLKRLQAPNILHLATHGFFLEDVQFVPPDSLDNRGITMEYFDNPNAPRSDRPINSETPLLRSGLALAGFNPRQSGDEDGVLTALEASNLNLYGTELVVLSACETGVGSVNIGEGVYGLRRAFVIAGAESLMMSLWQVSDQGTADLMSRYYQRLLDGEGRSTALQNTQLEMM